MDRRETPDPDGFQDGKTTVTIKQTAQQALLNWETFNVGKNTTLNFDQSKGGENVGQWIAFNKVSDPSANPTQILGNIKADGQVYIINSNGIIFGGSSQVNARGLTVSSLPINDNLINQGLLNNRDAQFLFSGLSVPGGADGTPDFNPEAPLAAENTATSSSRKARFSRARRAAAAMAGASCSSAPNVTNKGTISTEAGQTILAAGLQVGGRRARRQRSQPARPRRVGGCGRRLCRHGHQHADSSKPSPAASR